MTFETSIARLLGNEGGLVDNPKDPGGLTQWGISQRSYPSLNIRALTREQAEAVYLHDFWMPIDADEMPDAIGFQLLDFAVNSGVGTALRVLQRAVGVADDGHIGPVTLAAIRAVEPHDLIMRFLAERLIFMTNCANWPDASRGWVRRVAANLKFGASDV